MSEKEENIKLADILLRKECCAIFQTTDRGPLEWAVGLARMPDFWLTADKSLSVCLEYALFHELPSVVDIPLGATEEELNKIAEFSAKQATKIPELRKRCLMNEPEFLAKLLGYLNKMDSCLPGQESMWVSECRKAILEYREAKGL